MNKSFDYDSPFVKRLYEELETAYIITEKSYNSSVADDILKDKFKINIIRKLDADQYGGLVKKHFVENTADEDIEVRFADTLMWHLWSPHSTGQRITPDIFKEVEKKAIMSNIAKTHEVAKLLSHFDSELLNTWKTQLGITMDYIHPIEICKSCLTKIGLPCIPVKDEIRNDSYKKLSPRMILEEIIDASVSIPPTFFEEDVNKCKQIISKIRDSFEHFFRMYISFLSVIPEINDVLFYLLKSNEQIKLPFWSTDNIDDFLSVDDFIEHDGGRLLTFGALKKLLSTTQKIINKSGSIVFKNRFYPYINDPNNKRSMEIINVFKHNYIGDYKSINLQDLKQSIEIYINAFKKIELIPRTVVFYRKENDIFGTHYKGNTLSNESYVMLSQKSDLELGKFYFVSSIVGHAFLEGYTKKIPEFFIPEEIK